MSMYSCGCDPICSCSQVPCPQPVPPSLPMPMPVSAYAVITPAAYVAPIADTAGATTQQIAQTLNSVINNLIAVGLMRPQQSSMP